MKRWILAAICVCALTAQAPVPDDTAVATVNGKKVTAAEVRTMFASESRFGPAFKSDPGTAIRDYLIVRELAAEADKLKLGDESPYKEQIDYARAGVLASALLSHELNAYMPSEESVQTYYKANQSHFEQASISDIRIAFNAAATPKGTSEQALRDAAAGVVAAAHGVTRSEADAKRMAEDLMHQAQGGTDFATLAKKYSEDEMTKAGGGVFGTISATSSFPPELKQAALALKAGEVSPPVKYQSAYYLIRCDSKTARPIHEVHEQVLTEIRQQHVHDMYEKIQAKFKASNLNTDALAAIGNGK
jgi:PPIC-type PPIASE domain